MKYFFSTCLLLLATTLTNAQVGIGTSNVNTSARLQVDATNKGFLPPRVTLTGTADASTISTPATGLLVYNTATAGTSPSNVTPGFYYYDGAKWQRIINQQPDATVSFNTADPNTGSPTFTPSNAASTDFIYVSSVNNSQWTWNGSAYVTYVPPPSTPWMLSGGTSDAGSNKTGGIYRSGRVAIGGATTPNATLDLRTSPTSTSDPGAGYLGVGTTSSAANTVGAGAIRYNTSSGGVLQYSNGAAWNTLSSNVQKSLVSGYFDAGTYSHTYYGDLAATEVVDVNSDFASSTFTAPRTGYYTFTATISSNNVNDIIVNGTWELQVVPSVGAGMVSRYLSPAACTNYVATVTGAYTVQLTAGATVKFKVFNWTGSQKTLAAADYNRFSIVEN
jgi:hypothetical protein